MFWNVRLSNFFNFPIKRYGARFPAENLDLQLLWTPYNDQVYFLFSFFILTRPQYFSVWSHKIVIFSIPNKVVHYWIKFTGGLIQALLFFQTWINCYMPIELLLCITLCMVCCVILIHYHLSATFDNLCCSFFNKAFPAICTCSTVLTL